MIAREVEENIDVENEEPRTKEEELAELQGNVKKVRELVNSEGWKSVRETFIKRIVEMQEEILSRATRIEVAGKRIDGMQAIQLEAMEKGQLKGMWAVLNYPIRYLESAQEQAEMLKRVLEMKEEKEQDDAA